MSSTSLDHPDPTAERMDPARSTRAADELIACYGMVRRREYEEADKRLSAVERLEKSPKQALRVLYMRATASLGMRALPAGRDLLAEGLEQAEHFDDYGALAQFAYLYATTQRELGEPIVAARHTELALEAWREYVGSDATDAQDTVFELDLLILLNQLYFFSGRFTRAERVFRVARGVAQRTSVPPVRRANLAWIEALFHRWRSEPGRALDCGLRALAVLDEHGTLLERSRLRTALADIAMDLVEHSDSPANGGVSQHFLGLAHTFLGDSLNGLRASGDLFALGLGQLANARLARLANRNVDRLGLIDDVGNVALALGNRTVVGQVWSARGDEYLAQGERGSAVYCYLEALDILKGAHMRAHSVWALRALNRAQVGDR